MKLLLVTVVYILTPALAYSATYYVAKTGSDSQSCNVARSASTAKLSINAGLRCIQPGDTLIINTGVYTEAIINNIPSGINVSNPTRIIGMNGARWTLRPGGNSQCFRDAAAVYLKDKRFIEIADIIADGANCTANMGALFWIAGNSHDNVLRDAELKNLANATGLLFQGGTTSKITVSNVVSHDHGKDRLDHCLYPSGSGHIFEYVEAYNCSGHGIHLYNRTGVRSDNNIIRWSYFHDNGERGILIGSGSNNVAEKNVVRNNGRRSKADGITVGFHGAYSNRVYANTIAYNSGNCVGIRRGSINSKVMDNICWANGNDAVRDLGKASIIEETRSTSSQSDAAGAPSVLWRSGR